MPIRSGFPRHFQNSILGKSGEELMINSLDELKEHKIFDKAFSLDDKKQLVKKQREKLEDYTYSKNVKRFLSYLFKILFIFINIQSFRCLMGSEKLTT